MLWLGCGVFGSSANAGAGQGGQQRPAGRAAWQAHGQAQVQSSQQQPLPKVALCYLVLDAQTRSQPPNKCRVHSQGGRGYTVIL